MPLRILMCPPDFYAIRYVINPWMSTLRQADHRVAEGQWQALRHILEDRGAVIELVAPSDGLPDLVFTANAALIYGNRAILSRFKHPQRQGEEPHFRARLETLGFAVEDAPERLTFEGAGDALFLGDTLVAGYRMRSDARGHQQIGEMLGVRVLPLELADPYFYHLDTCFCPLDAHTALFYPDAFDSYGLRVLEDLVPRLIEVERAEAKSFACNAIVLGNSVVTNVGCPALHRQLAAAGYDPIATPLGEFVKAGGSAKCLTLRLDGEVA